MKKSPDKNLYFLKIIQNVYDHEDLPEAIRQAIEKIKMKASDPECHEGYENFLAFIDEIEKTIRLDESINGTMEYWTKVKKALQILTDDFKGNDKDKKSIFDYFEGDHDFELIKKEITELAGTDAPFFIEIEKDGKLIASQICDKESLPIIIPGLSRGEYRIILSNGREIWRRKLNDTELRWQIAFPDEQYPAAAMTEPPMYKSTISESMLTGLKIEIFPGIEIGTMQISLVTAEEE